VRLEAYNDNAEHPVAGEDAITLYIDCWRKNVQNTATIVRGNYNVLHSFTYGDILAIEPAVDSNNTDFIVDWKLIPECVNTGYAHPEARYDMSHGEATREKSQQEFFNHWAENVDGETIVDSDFWVNSGLDNAMSTPSPIMLVPILFEDGIIALQDVNTDRSFGYLDISQTFDTLHDAAAEHIDSVLRDEFLDDMRYPFGVTIRNEQHLD